MYFIFITNSCSMNLFLFQAANAPISNLVDIFWIVVCPLCYRNLDSCNYNIVWSTSQFFDHRYYSLSLPISSYHRLLHILAHKVTLLLSSTWREISFLNFFSLTIKSKVHWETSKDPRLLLKINLKLDYFSKAKM